MSMLLWIENNLTGVEEMVWQRGVDMAVGGAVHGWMVTRSMIFGAR
jgi:hypothetical protein